MITKTEPLILFQRKNFVEIFHDKSNNWIYANWKGTPTTEQVKEGVENVLDAIKEFKAGKVLNDNRELMGTWTAAMPWIVNDWWPRAMAEGFEAIAFIYSQDVFGKFSVDSLIKQTDERGPVKQKPFQTYNEAAKWLEIIV